MNKKAIVDVSYYVIRLLIVAVILLVLLAEIGFFTNIDINTHQLEEKLIAERILNGPQGIAYTNPDLGMKEPGTVDLSNLKVPLDKAFAEGYTLKKDEKIYGAKVSLYRNYYDAINFENALETTYVNEDLIKKYLPIARAGVVGPGSAEYYVKINPVTIYYGQSRKPPELGFVVVEVIKRT